MLRKPCCSQGMQALRPFLSVTCTYTNAEPCVMCTGACTDQCPPVSYSGIEARPFELTGADEQNPTFDLPSHEVLAHGQGHEVVGPTDDKELEKAIVADHLSFWVH